MNMIPAGVTLAYKVTDTAMLLIYGCLFDGKTDGVFIQIYHNNNRPENLFFHSTKHIDLFTLRSCDCPDIDTHISRDEDINCGKVKPFYNSLTPDKVSSIAGLQGIVTPAKYKEIYNMIKGYLDAYTENNINIRFDEYLKSAILLPRYEMSLKLIEQPKEETK